jgi:small-conductance mechanosensitive channel
MSAADLRIPFASFWAHNHSWVSALITLAVFGGAALLSDRWFSRRSRLVADRVLKHGISPEADTRLRFVRRLVWLSLLLLGLFIALSQFTGIGRLAASVLASGAIAAAIIGFAARQTLANLVAGIMLAVTQPLRVGDWVTFEGNYGVVEDVRLNYTMLRSLGDQLIVIPNERLASGVLLNDTLGVPAVGLDVAVWIPHATDAAAALAALRELTGATVTVAEVTVEGARLAVGGERVAPSERSGREAELREACLLRLRAEGLLGG